MIYEPLKDSEYNCEKYIVKASKNVQGDENAYKLIRIS